MSRYRIHRCTTALAALLLATVVAAPSGRADPIRISQTVAGLSWVEVDIPEPVVDRFVIRASLDLAALRKEIIAQITGPASSAVAAKFGTVNWVNFRFSNFRVTVGQASFAPGASPNSVQVVVVGSVIASQERLVWRWRGFHSRFEWEAQGDRDVASLSAPFTVTLCSTQAASLAQQSITVGVDAGSPSVVINIQPLKGQTFRGMFKPQVPKSRTISMADAVSMVPAELQSSNFENVRFTTVSDSVVTVEADLVAAPPVSSPPVPTSQPSPAPETSVSVPTPSQSSTPPTSSAPSTPPSTPSATAPAPPAPSPSTTPVSPSAAAAPSAPAPSTPPPPSPVPAPPAPAPSTPPASPPPSSSSGPVPAPS